MLKALTETSLHLSGLLAIGCIFLLSASAQEPKGGVKGANDASLRSRIDADLFLDQGNQIELSGRLVIAFVRDLREKDIRDIRKGNIIPGDAKRMIEKPVLKAPDELQVEIVELKSSYQDVFVRVTDIWSALGPGTIIDCTLRITAKNNVQHDEYLITVLMPGVHLEAIENDAFTARGKNDSKVVDATLTFAIRVWESEAVKASTQRSQAFYAQVSRAAAIGSGGGFAIILFLLYWRYFVQTTSPKADVVLFGPESLSPNDVPSVCIACGKPKTTQKDVCFRWSTHTGSGAIGLIAMLATQRQKQVPVPLCNRHAWFSNFGSTHAGWLFLMVVPVLFGFIAEGMSSEDISGEGRTWRLVVFICVIILIVIFSVSVFNMAIRAKTIVEDYVLLGNVSAEFARQAELIAATREQRTRSPEA